MLQKCRERAVKLGARAVLKAAPCLRAAFGTPEPYEQAQDSLHTFLLVSESRSTLNTDYSPELCSAEIVDDNEIPGLRAAQDCLWREEQDEREAFADGLWNRLTAPNCAPAQEQGQVQDFPSSQPGTIWGQTNGVIRTKPRVIQPNHSFSSSGSSLQRRGAVRRHLNPLFYRNGRRNSDHSGYAVKPLLGADDRLILGHFETNANYETRVTSGIFEVL